MAIDWQEILQRTLGDFTVAAFPPHMVLPALPLAVSQFVEKSGDPEVEINDLAQIVATDSGLTFELLKQANSASVGLKTRAGSAGQALSVLGLRTCRNLVVTVGTRTAIQARESRLLNQNCFWSAALQKALFSSELAKLLGTDEDIAFAGALLQDYLLPILTNELYGQYLTFIKTRDERQVNMCEFEQSKFGWDHAVAGACLARQWKLPDDLVCCILFHHLGLEALRDPVLGSSPVAAVALAALLPDQLRQSFHGLEQLLSLEKKWPGFNLQAIAKAVDAKQAEAGLGMRNDFPLVRRCESLKHIQANNADGSLIAAA